MKKMATSIIYCTFSIKSGLALYLIGKQCFPETRSWHARVLPLIDTTRSVLNSDISKTAFAHVITGIILSVVDSWCLKHPAVLNHSDPVCLW